MRAQSERDGTVTQTRAPVARCLRRLSRPPQTSAQGPDYRRVPNDRGIGGPEDGAAGSHREAAEGPLKPSPLG